ncbi:putative RNA methyltransferase [Micromonospora sp. NPDC050417]|uniref:putative RNA methyltransferase n=1 Tax=Micromonospora sp. NPDC050417 TaxID=3364280 RepID=UPI0037BC7A0B
MSPDPLRFLRCPVCGEPLSGVETEGARALRCPRGHSFDLARQGYVNLLAGRAPHTGDSPGMVTAREEFLGAGHYDLVSAALAAAATGSSATETSAAESDSADATYPRLVVDAGAGTGWHLAAVLDAIPDAVGLALDVSKPALRRAARAHPRAAAALCDTWQTLPLADASTTLLLNVFAPRNGPEFRRVLRPDGLLLVVTPAADHLTELVEQLDLLRVDPTKSDRVAGSLGDGFDLVGRSRHIRRMRLRRAEVATLVGMGPSAWHIAPARLAARIEALPEPVDVTAAVELGVYRPR